MSYYSYKPILHTSADAIVVPIFPKQKGILQEWCEFVFREDYTSELREEQKVGGHLALGLPSVYIAPKFDKVFFNFPVEASESIERLKKFMEASRTLFAMAESYNLSSIAVGSFEKALPWNLVETIMLKTEQYRENQLVELWLHPPEEDEEELYIPSEATLVTL